MPVIPHRLVAVAALAGSLAGLLSACAGNIVPDFRPPVVCPTRERLDVHDDDRMRLNVIALDDEHVAQRVYSACIP
jgi:hypothetical protein